MNEKLVFLLINGVLVVLLLIALVREYFHEKFQLTANRVKVREDAFTPIEPFSTIPTEFPFKESFNGKMSVEIACQVLGVHSFVNKKQVKEAYHELIKKYHPDHVSFLGSEFQQMAEEKTRTINSAYHVIMKQLDSNPRYAKESSIYPS
jgi:DnaJ-domain-containing protein 1